MIPIRLRHPSVRLPLMTLALVVVNVSVFVGTWVLSTAPEAIQILRQHGFDAARLGHAAGWLGLLSGQFLHTGWLHLAVNMLFLWIFGDSLEQALGRLRFLALYLGSGALGFLLESAVNPWPGQVIVGASAAVAGVMGGAMLMLPRARVDLLVYLVVMFRTVSLPVWLVLGVWFGLQVWAGLGGVGRGVAHLSHVGGFVAGLVLCWPVWRARGGRHVWRRWPPAPVEARAVPVVRNHRTALPAPQRRGLFGPARDQ